MSKKVLIVYASGGMGHVMAAKAIEQAFRRKYPEVEVKNVNVIDFASRLYKFFFVDGYNYVSAKLPNLWAWLYKTFDNKNRQGLPSLLSYLSIKNRFIPFIKEFNPDFIISTHPLPMIIVSRSKDKNIIDVLSSMVCTDFGCHSFWVDPEVNYYFGAVDNVAKCLMEYGVSREKIAITGIPIEEKFAQPLVKDNLIKKFGLKTGVFTILIVGGQFDFQTLKTVVSGIIDQHDGNVQFLVVAGRDANLKDALDKSDLNSRFANVKIFGFVDYMQELMTVADIIFSKAGGLTVSECLAKGLPLVINKVIPGQEEDNVNYLVSHNAAIKVNDTAGIISAINDLVGNSKKILAMQASAKSLGQPHSAEALADFVVSKI
ncbi:MAG: glycosyltransferase [Candidatus Buchananbacteria bacterium]